MGSEEPWELCSPGCSLLFLVDHFIGLRVSVTDENIGLDLTQHNEEGYDLSS
jgi:ammonia channel protein AmtB